MKKKIMIAMAASLLFLSGIASVCIASPQGRRSKGTTPRTDRVQGPMNRDFGLLRRLDLSEDQKAQVKLILEAEREANMTVHEALRANREALREATKDGAFFDNQSTVEALAQEQGSLSAQLIVSRERVKAQIYALLTPDQRVKLSSLEEHGGPGNWRRGHRPGDQGSGDN